MMLGMRRPTVKDIARAAGVSPGAVSFALNDKPGVSAGTRARIKAVAEALGWAPNVAALALSGSRAGAIGLVIARTDQAFAEESFFMRLIAGMEEVLTHSSTALVLQLVGTGGAESTVHRQWWRQGRVDGVIVVDPAVDDKRWALLQELGMPATVVGATDQTPLPGVRIDDAAAVESIVEHLAGLGHERIARVSGTRTLAHTRSRDDSFVAACRARGMTSVVSESTDFTERAGLHETQLMMNVEQPPTAIVYDNEVLALGGLSELRSRGLHVPDDVAVVSFEDSPVCRVINPAITALRRDPSELGRDAVRMLLDVIDGRDPDDIVEDPPQLIVRGSTRPVNEAS